MLDTAAKAAEEQRQYDLAKRLLDSSLTIRGEVSGEQSVDYGLGLLRLGDLEKVRSDENAKDFYSRALAILGDRPETWSALMHLGDVAGGQKDYTTAFNYFERAARVDPARSGMPLMFMALVRQREGSTAEADSLFQQALTAIEPNSRNATVVMDLYSRFLRDQGRGDEALSIENRVADLRKQLDSETKARGAVAYLRAGGGTARALPTAVRPTSGPNVYRVGAGVTPPKLLQKVEPEYTIEARAARYQGTVLVSVEIGPDGLARNMEVIRGLGLGLDEKAMYAIGQWKFQPGTKDGQPVAVLATVEVNFKLL
jgi:TonB family protein